jgi:lysophospholipase L1-like esterase
VLRALLVACAAFLAAAAPADAQSLFVSGDSLAVGARPYMPGALPGWKIRTFAAVGRHTTEGTRVLRARPTLPRFLAVSLGTNDDPRDTSAFRDAIEQHMAIAGEGRCVAWANIVRPPVAGTTYAGYNRALREASTEHDNLEIVDWRRLVRRHPGRLSADGVHASAAGYEARARAYARALRRCHR